MKLSAYAKKQGVTYQTAYNWFAAGLIPNARQMPNKTILIDESINIEPKTVKECVIYARVSNKERKDNLDYQVDRINQYCTAKGYSVVKTYKEVASGMNDKRREFWKMIDSKPDIIVVEHKDRLTRTGFNYLETLLPRLGINVEVVNRDEIDEQDLIKDLVSIITSFCCRLYGLRRGFNKAKEIKKTIETADE